MNLDQLIRARLSANGASLPDDDQARKELPNLWDMLTCRIVLDGVKKRPSRLTVQLGVGEWVVGLSDEDLAMSIETTSPTLSGVFLALQTALESGKGWKEWSKREPKIELPEKKRKKKG